MRRSQPTIERREIFPTGGNPCRLEVTGARWKLLVVLLWALVTIASQKGYGAEVAVKRGEFGADLKLLASFCSGPKNQSESNYYLDMWAGRRMGAVARLNGLTNNHTLFINSHGKGHLGPLGARYAFYPHQSLLPPGTEEPLFTAKDIARMLGPEKVASIHNVVISSCDLESCFSSAEIRKFFAHATNVVHTPRGEAGYQPMFYSALVNRSSEIRPLFETMTEETAGRPGYEISSVPATGAKKLNPYVAELFLPKARKPYRVQVAGRELLEPLSPVILLSQSQRGWPDAP